jgi:hypothetical protein
MVRSLADPSNASRQINHPRRPASTKRPSPAVLRHYALRLRIFPVVLGAGGRLFGQTNGKKPMRLLDTQTLEGGIAYLIYQPIRDP